MRSLTVTGGGGVDLHVVVHEPAGVPVRATVVLTHGFSMTSQVWSRQLAGLGPGVRVVAFDLRGHGRSGRPTERESYRDPLLWADDLDAVVRATSGGAPVVLVGWSYGARVVGDYLFHHGDGLLAGVVFVGARVRPDQVQDPTTLGSGLDAKVGMLSPDAAVSTPATAEFVSLCFASPPDDETVDLVVAGALTVPWWVREAMDGRPLTVHEAAPRCGVPVLAVHGALDQMFPPAAAHVTGEVFGADVVVYDGCGHAPFLEEPDRFNDDLARFVARCTSL